MNGKDGNLPLHLKLGWISTIESLAGGLIDIKAGKAFPSGSIK